MNRIHHYLQYSVLLFVSAVLFTHIYATPKERYMVIVREAPCYLDPSSGASTAESPLPFGTVLFSTSVISHDTDFDFIRARHPHSGKTVYVPREMTMLSPDISVERSANSVTLSGTTEAPFFYVPQDLVQIPEKYTLHGREIYAQKSAVDDLTNLLEEAYRHGHSLKIARGYADLAQRIERYEAAIAENPKQSEIPKPLSSPYGSGNVFDITDTLTKESYEHYVVQQEAWEWLDTYSREYGFKKSGTHYTLTYTATKEKVPEPEVITFPEQIDETVDFGSICSVRILKKSDYRFASYVWIHHNEKSGGKTMHYALDTYGGHSVFIVNKDRRNLYVRYGRKNYAVDPNRIFTDHGVDLNLKKHYPRISRKARGRIKREVRKIRSKLLESFDWNKNKYLIALHSSRSGSRFSINEFNKKNAYLTYTNPSHNPKNLYYTTSLDDYYFFKSRKYNVVYQRTTEDDGSLSVYAAQHNLPYINIEVEEGEDEAQKRMLDLALECIQHNYRIKDF